MAYNYSQGYYPSQMPGPAKKQKARAFDYPAYQQPPMPYYHEPSGYDMYNQAAPRRPMPPPRQMPVPPPMPMYSMPAPVGYYRPPLEEVYDYGHQRMPSYAPQPRPPRKFSQRPSPTEYEQVPTLPRIPTQDTFRPPTSSEPIQLPPIHSHSPESMRSPSQSSLSSRPFSSKIRPHFSLHTHHDCLVNPVKSRPITPSAPPRPQHSTSDRYRLNRIPSEMDYRPYTFQEYRHLKSRDQNMRLPRGLGPNETDQWKIEVNNLI